MGQMRLALKEYIDSKKITRYRLAKLSNVSYETIDDYYKNKVQRYDSYILTRICDALECELGDIIEYKRG